MQETNSIKSIKYWAEDDRPREKLINKGRDSLSDAELIAILIGSGNKEDSAVELSKKILANVNNNLIELSKLQIGDFLKFKGVGEAKAVSIIAALELGRRRREEEIIDKKKITSSIDVKEFFQAELSDKHYEEFWILLLNKANKIIKKHQISEGGISGTVVDSKKIFSVALENKASSLILCHNHPSGNLSPSNEDIQLTNKIKNAGTLLDIKVLDHVIIGENNFFSFADEGLI